MTGSYRLAAWRLKVQIVVCAWLVPLEAPSGSPPSPLEQLLVAASSPGLRPVGAPLESLPSTPPGLLPACPCLSTEPSSKVLVVLG